MDMTVRQGRGRRRRACRAAAVVLLVLVSGALGCQATGGRTAERSRIDPPSAPAAPLAPLPTAIVFPDRPPSATATEQASSPKGTGDAALVLAAAKEKTKAEKAALPEQLPPLDKIAPVPRKIPDKKDRIKREVLTYQVDRTLPSPVAGMTTPVIPPPEQVHPITLGAALALAGVQNPAIGLADQEVRISRARQLQARLLLIPNVNVGSSYHYHSGPVQSSFGAIRKVTLNALYYGFGANTVAAETIKIPGLFLSTHLGEAIYEPLAARQVVANRRYRFAATRNQVLLDVSQRYLALLGAEGRLAVIRQSEKDFQEAVRLTTNYFKTGTGDKADAERAQADLRAVQAAELRAQEEVAIAAADLAQLLNLDPSVRLQTGDVPIKVVEFVDPKEPLPKLLEIALSNRPEVRAAAAAIAASEVRVRQERTRPFYPLLVVGFSAGDFGGGAVASTNGNVPNPHTGGTPFSPTPASGGQTIPPFGHIAGRTDFDVLALWTLKNFGWGNLALVKERRAQLGEAQAERLRVMNQVAVEVADAYNLAAAQLQQIEGARQEVIHSTQGFQSDLERIMGKTKARPIELLNNAKLLLQGRHRLLNAIIAYDEAQFKLFVALGQPPTLAVDEAPPALP